MLKEVYINSLAWVLNGEVSRSALLPSEDLLQNAIGSEFIKAFSAKPYLQSVKGFLDPAGHLFLAACSQLKNNCTSQLSASSRTGIVSMTHYGAASAAYTFFSQLKEKGSRFASPMVFPHSYASTAANLAAIEFGWAGPHMIFYGKQSCLLAFDFATQRLQDNSADEMLLVFQEAYMKELQPENKKLLNGAFAILLSKKKNEETLFTIKTKQLFEQKEDISSGGAVKDVIDFMKKLK